jgi:hypothetical protein
MNQTVKYIYEKGILNHKLMSIFYPNNDQVSFNFNVNLSFNLSVKHLPIFFKMKNNFQKEYFISIETERVDAVFEDATLYLESMHQFKIKEIDKIESKSLPYKEWPITNRIIAINAVGLANDRLLACKGWNKEVDFIKKIYLILEDDYIIDLNSCVDEKNENNLNIFCFIDNQENYKRTARYSGFDEF